MKKFRAYRYKIEEFEVVRETEKQIIYKSDGHEYREAKRSNWQNWYETRTEAKEALVSEAKANLSGLYEQAKYQKQFLLKIQAL